MKVTDLLNENDQLTVVDKIKTALKGSNPMPDTVKYGDTAYPKQKQTPSKPVKEAPIDMTGDPNDPMIYGHAKANPMSLKGRIMQARSQLQNLANMADSNDLVVWEQICKLAKGGMFMGLEQNLEQIRHGIQELAAKRRKGGRGSRGIDKNIGEEWSEKYKNSINCSNPKGFSQRAHCQGKKK